MFNWQQYKLVGKCNESHLIFFWNLYQVLDSFYIFWHSISNSVQTLHNKEFSFVHVRWFPFKVYESNWTWLSIASSFARPLNFINLFNDRGNVYILDNLNSLDNLVLVITLPMYYSYQRSGIYCSTVFYWKLNSQNFECSPSTAMQQTLQFQNLLLLSI